MIVFIVFLITLRIEYCHQYKLDIDCINGLNKGINYKGTVNITENGRPCILWSRIQPNNNSYHDYHNYCRNPDNSSRLWCYTGPSESSRQYCNVTYCGYLCPDLKSDVTMDLPKNLNEHKVFDIVQFRCAAGYTLSGSNNLVCRYVPNDIMASWNDSQPTCLGKPCPVLPYILNAVHQSKTGGYHYPDNITVTCNRGYIINNINVLRCQDNGQWSTPTPSCIGKPCPVLPYIPNAEPQTGIYRYPESTTVSCNPGYMINDIYVLRCQDNGQWSTPTPSCFGQPCPPLPYIPNAVPLSRTGGYRYPENITVTCNRGYIINDIHFLRCQDNGQWSTPTPSCIGIECPTLELTPHVSEPIKPSGYRYKEEARFGCEIGYFLSGSQTLTCLGSGEWSSQEPTCKAVVCPDLPNIPHLKHLPGKDEYHYNDTVILKCDVGFTLSGPPWLTCTARDRQSTVYWEGDQPHCQAVTCPMLNERCGLQWFPNLTTFHYNDTVQFSCNDGYQLFGPSILLCTIISNMSVGEWNRKQPVCILSTEELKGVTYLVYGISIATIITIAVVTVVLLYCYFMKRITQSRKLLYEDIKINSGQGNNEEQVYSELSETSQ